MFKLLTMKRIILPVAGLVCLLMACEKTIKVDIPERDSRLVINGLLEKNQLLEVKVGKSRGVLEPINNLQPLPEQYTVTTAEVVMYENNVAIDTLVYQPASYSYKTVHNKTVSNGSTYTVKVNAPGFVMAEATSQQPSQSVIAETNIIRHIRNNAEGLPIDEINIKLDDPAGEKNFYLVQVISIYYAGSWTFCIGTKDKDIEAMGDETDPMEQDECFNSFNLLMKDVNFNGTRKHLKLTARSDMLQERTEPSGNIVRPYVKVYRITEEQFKFLKSYYTHVIAGDNPFAEPSNVFSNVRNGYGIFALSTVAIDTLR